jgi:hypothetical protein
MEKETDKILREKEKLDECYREHQWHVFDNFYEEISRTERKYAAWCGECQESRSIIVKLN